MPWVETYLTPKGVKKYCVRWRDESGRQHSKTTGRDRGAAYRYRNQMEEAGIDQDLGLVDPRKTVTDLAAEYTAYRTSLKRRPKTIKAIKYALAKLTAVMGGHKITRIRPQQLERFKDGILAKQSVNGFKDVFRVVNGLFRFAHRRGYIRTNPAQDVDDLEEQAVARFLNEREVNIILHSFRTNPGMEKIVKVALYEFMRKNEVLLVRPDQVKREGPGRGRIFMERAQIKTKKDKSVPVHPEVAEILFGPPETWFNLGWTEGRINQNWRRGMARVNRAHPGFGKARFHDLKHTAVSNYLKNGGTLAELSHMTGNDIKSLSSVYAHFEDRHLQEKIGLVSYKVSARVRQEISRKSIGQKIGQHGQERVLSRTIAEVKDSGGGPGLPSEK